MTIKQTNIIAGVIFIAAIFCFYKACQVLRIEKPPQLAQKKSDSTKVVIQELTRDNVIYRDRWHDGKTQFIHVVDSIIAYSADTCKESVIAVKIECDKLISKADSLIDSDSLIIVSQASLINFNGILIDSLHNKVLSLRHDSIPKSKRKAYFKGLKHGFVVGLGLGAATNLIKVK